jgi:hypothetical protein
MSDRLLLIVEFGKNSNFWIEGERATWAPKKKELEDIVKALSVIDKGNAKPHIYA